MSSLASNDAGVFKGSTIEHVLCEIPKVYAFRVPPKRTLEGHKAKVWREAGPVWSGHLRIISIGTECSVRLINSGTPEKIFATCPVRPDNCGKDATKAGTSSVERAIDSMVFLLLSIYSIR